MREMKDSGVAWIGEIPKEWGNCSLKNTVKTHFGGCWGEDPKDDANDRLCIRIADFDFAGQSVKENASTFRNYTDAQIEKCTLKDGDLIVEKSGGGDKTPVGRVVIYRKKVFETDALFANFSECLRLNDGVANKYIAYHLKALYYAFDMHYYFRQTTGLQNLDMPAYLKASICLPPLPEQRRIADRLDVACSKVDALIANQQAQIEKLKAYKQSLITEVVTRGLDPDAPMKDSGVDVYPYVPQNWNVQKTLNLLTMPITDGPHTTPELLSEGIPFVSAEAVSCGNGSIDFDHIRGFISQEFYEECCKKYVPQLNDIYMIKSGATTGRVSIVDTDRIFTIWSPLAVFRCNAEIIYFRFLYYFIQSTAYQRQVQFGWTYGTQQNIGMRTLERLKVFVPPLSEQQQIADYLDGKCAKIDGLIAIKQQKIEKLGQYKKSLIYEYVTGKKEA